MTDLPSVNCVEKCDKNIDFYSNCITDPEDITPELFNPSNITVEIVELTVDMLYPYNQEEKEIFLDFFSGKRVDVGPLSSIPMPNGKLSDQGKQNYLSNFLAEAFLKKKFNLKTLKLDQQTIYGTPDFIYLESWFDVKVRYAPWNDTVIGNLYNKVRKYPRGGQLIILLCDKLLTSNYFLLPVLKYVTKSVIARSLSDAMRNSHIDKIPNYSSCTMISNSKKVEIEDTKFYPILLNNYYIFNNSKGLATKILERLAGTGVDLHPKEYVAQSMLSLNDIGIIKYPIENIWMPVVKGNMIKDINCTIISNSVFEPYFPRSQLLIKKYDLINLFTPVDLMINKPCYIIAYGLFLWDKKEPGDKKTKEDYIYDVEQECFKLGIKNFLQFKSQFPLSLCYYNKDGFIKETSPLTQCKFLIDPNGRHVRALLKNPDNDLIKYTPDCLTGFSVNLNQIDLLKIEGGIIPTLYISQSRKDVGVSVLVNYISSKLGSTTLSTLKDSITMFYSDIHITIKKVDAFPLDLFTMYMNEFKELFEDSKTMLILFDKTGSYITDKNFNDSIALGNAFN